MYVAFPLSQRDFLAARERKSDAGKVTVRIRFSDGKDYGEIGEINFIDVSVNRATDSILLRAKFLNPSGELIDGQLVQVNLQSGEPEERVLVPQAALIADQAGIYVFVVEDGKAVLKRIKPGPSVGADAIVEQGLSGGEQVIVQNVQGVRPGIAVQATPLRKTVDRH